MVKKSQHLLDTVFNTVSRSTVMLLHKPEEVPLEIYEALREDHRNLIHILERLEGTSPDASKLRRELLDDLELELRSHAEAEEKAFLCLMKENNVTKENASEAADDMTGAIAVLRDLIIRGAKDDHWDQHFDQLKELIEAHIEADEQLMFPKARQIVDDVAAERMAEQFDDVKDDIMQRNHLH
jgi:iron-sulfur cluster repair protein YtfE (RIC family)